MKYEKPAFSLDQKIYQLRQRGMVVSDVSKLEHLLNSVGYYRLSAYTMPFERGFLPDGSRDHYFKTPITVEMIVELYEFDRRLRLLVMDGLERIEVAVRTRWADSLALAHGPHAYLNSDAFHDPVLHAHNLSKLALEIEKSRETYVLHYKNKYGDPSLPPLWAITESFSLGQLSHWFKNTKDVKIKEQVTEFFGMPTIQAFEGILHALTPVRNTCAHHGRLWNKRFTLRLPHIRSIQDQLIRHSAGTTDDLLLHNYLVVIHALLDNTAIDPAWGERIRMLLEERTASDQARMGFFENWQARAPWCVQGKNS